MKSSGNQFLIFSDKKAFTNNSVCNGYNNRVARFESYKLATASPTDSAKCVWHPIKN